MILACCVLVAGWGCKKSSPAPAGINYTADMGGVRNWHCVDSTNMVSIRLGVDTVIYSTDTFALTVVNDTTIIYPRVSDGTLHYVSTDSASGAYFFTGSYTTNGNWTVSMGLWYYYAVNSVDYKSYGGGPGSTWSHFYDQLHCSTR